MEKTLPTDAKSQLMPHTEGYVEKEITFLMQGLLHQRSSLLCQARNHIVISVLGEGFAKVHDLCSTGVDPVNARSHPDSTARMCITVCSHRPLSLLLDQPRSN
ncbi:hypothetical protein BsWGS_17867 [Bradybaena similaris]